MKKLKYYLVPLLCLLVTGCGTDWSRIKKANSVSIVGLDYSSTLTPYNEDGNSGQDGSTNIGIGEGLGVLGGVVTGKGLSGVNDAAKKRNENDTTTFQNIEAFQVNASDALSSVLKKNKYKIVDYEKMAGLNLKDSELSKSLIDDANSDLVVNAIYNFGYIMKDKNFGLSKEYRLALKVNLQFSDKDGFIGDRSYFIKSSKRKVTDGVVPAFEKEDFNSVEKAYIIKVRTDLKQLALKS